MDLTSIAPQPLRIQPSRLVAEWIPGWKKRGWRKAGGKPVLNTPIMQALDKEMAAAREAGRRITFRWVKGRAGHPLNEQADRLANSAASAYSRGEHLRARRDPGPRPRNRRRPQA